MSKTLSLFEGYGIEIESTVVDAETLEVRPVVDELLRAASGAEEWIEDFDDGPIGWSNELVSHVIELKTNGPAGTYDGLAERFRASTGRLNSLLAEGWGARLMPSGMHPWMDPRKETRLWPHDSSPVYQAYHRLFDCHRHGWANVQSVHLNLPFGDENEFARLMAAVRLVLPLIPALAASSPVVEGRRTGVLDNRLAFYRTNSARVRSMTADVIPEATFGIAEYRERVLGAVDRELGTIGADEVLRGQEWTNARGAIARFDRSAIEVRLIDAQECAAADLAVAAAVSALVRALVEERWCSFESQCEWPTETLVKLLSATIEQGPAATIGDPDYLKSLGVDAAETSSGRLWSALADATFDGPGELAAPLEVILSGGTLAQRILAAVGDEPDRASLRRVYTTLCDCLAAGTSFQP